MKKTKALPKFFDIEFSDRFVPKHGMGADAISLTGYKSGIFLEIRRNGCCPRRSMSLDIPLHDRDFDKLIGMLKRAKQAARKARGTRGS